ncbi:MAG TPA: HrpE/YscL family type III secretion apparatus protein [Lachnospiraceae bacterium]|nr:HrpE/YscL family type III secretion apparatus protein [Lachnospiraceae bacterium]
MGASRIEQLIEDIYEFVESCKMQPLSSTKVIVPKDELYDLIDELRLRTPDEIKRYQKIIANKDAILSDAREKAEAMLAQAQEQTNALINEHEIMQQAYYQANDIVEQATREAERILATASHDADEIRQGALAYTEEMLTDVERILAHAYESTKSKNDGLLDALKGNLDIVINNRKELCQTNTEPPKNQTEEDFAQTAAGQDDFDFDENTFLDDIE